LAGFQDFLGHGKIGGVRDLEIRRAMDNRHRMDASGDQGSDLISGSSPMLADGGEKLREGCGLRGFHREEVLARDGLLEKAVGVGAMERVCDRMGGRGSAVFFSGGEDLDKKGGRCQRARGVVNRDKISERCGAHTRIAMEISAQSWTAWRLQNRSGWPASGAVNLSNPIRVLDPAATMMAAAFMLRSQIE
jgi:hypothetical protein